MKIRIPFISFGNLAQMPTRMRFVGFVSRSRSRDRIEDRRNLTQYVNDNGKRRETWIVSLATGSALVAVGAQHESTLLGLGRASSRYPS
jgi:hypothetical protein